MSSCLCSPYHVVSSRQLNTTGSAIQDEQVSFLEVKDANCQVAGNYTCVVTNEYGLDQQQFTLTILGNNIETEADMQET